MPISLREDEALHQVAAPAGLQNSSRPAARLFALSAFQGFERTRLAGCLRPDYIVNMKEKPAVSSSVGAKAYHHGDLRETLIRAALAMIEDGVDASALSLREAARRAGVSAMAPYRHFADREALLAAVAEVGFGQLAAALVEADRASDPVDALVGQGVAYVAFAGANPSLFRLMFGAALAERHGVLAAAGGEAYAVMSDRVAAMSPGAAARDWALRCWATAHGLASLAVDGQLGEYEGTLAQLAERILRLDSLPHR